MIHEYALDPEALSDWQTARYLLDQFGVHHGRLISQFPGKWKLKVYEACEGCSPINKTRIVERLKQSDSKLIRMGRNFESQFPWVENAIRSHVDRPFRLIISRAEDISAGVVGVEDIGPNTPGWSPDEGRVARRAEALANTALPLLVGAKTICLVDPHFSCAARHCKPLEQIVKLVCLHSTANVIQYHLLAKEATAEWFSSKLSDNRLSWGRQTLKDREIHFIRWKERIEGEAFHARYILTDRGGLLYENGLDEGPEPQTTVVQPLNEVSWRSELACFTTTRQRYDFADAWCLTSGGVKGIQLSECGLVCGN